MKSCDELKQQSCCNSLSLCHSHTVTLVCDELLGGLPSQRGFPLLSLGTEPTHAAERWQQTRWCLCRGFLPFPPHPDCSRPPTRSGSLSICVLPRVLLHYAFDLCTKQTQWMLALQGFLSLHRQWCTWRLITSMWWWDDPVVIQKLDGIIIYSERSGVCRLFQTHVNTTSTLYMLSSQVAACAPMNLNNQGNQQQPCLFWKWSSTFSIMALQHSTGLTEKQLTRFKWPQFSLVLTL